MNPWVVFALAYVYTILAASTIALWIVSRKSHDGR